MLQLTFVLSLTKGHCSTMNNVHQLMKDLKEIPQNKLSFNIIRRLFIIFLYSLGFSEKRLKLCYAFHEDEQIIGFQTIRIMVFIFYLINHALAVHLL